MNSRVVDGGWLREFEDGLELRECETLIVSPFIKSSALRKLVANPSQKIRVVTRFNLDDFAHGASETDALRQLLNANASIRGVRNLHAKLYVFGESRAIITSANLTRSGMDRNHELGVVTGDHGLIANCQRYFEHLWERAGSDLSTEDLECWDAKINHWLAYRGRVVTRNELGDHGVEIGLSRTHEHPRVSVFDDRSQAYVKFLGKRSEGVSSSRTVLEELTAAGCHWALGYPANKRPRSVQNGAVMYIARLVGSDDIRVIGRGIGLKYRPGHDDATEEDIKRRDWKSDYPRYIRVHHTEFVDGTLENGVSLLELMNSLGAQSFASTARNYADGGSRNINPRLAIRQQPSVELTDEAASWLRKRLEQCFDEHGKIRETTLSNLDWPHVPSARDRGE